MANDPGRPAYPEETYQAWLEELRPFLERGKSLYRSIELAGLLSHKNRVYQKYNLNDWFREKVDAYQKALGETTNDIFVSLIEAIHKKVKLGEKLDREELDTLKFYAEKSRSTQSFFVNRFETAAGRPVEEVIGDLEQKETETVDDVNEHLKAEDPPALPQQNQTLPENTQPVIPPPATEQPQPQIVEGNITPDAIDPNATPTT